jgi:predicted RNase H-like nuclease (RuvC/YqgF family)
MGAAAYNRGSKAIRESISRDAKKVDPLTFVNARLEDENERLRARVAELESELSRAKRLIGSLRATKECMAIKLMAMQEICRETKREFLSEKAYPHAYGAMILINRLGLK